MLITKILTISLQIPIISTDIERMRRPAPQRPFSDAYMNGMSKRRKIERRAINLRDSLQTALSSAGVRPIVRTNTEDIITEISENGSLNYSFDDLLRTAISERIVKDEDYSQARNQNPHRFTHSDKYFSTNK